MIKVKSKRTEIEGIPVYESNVTLDFKSINEEIGEFTAILLSLVKELKDSEKFGKKFANNVATIQALKDIVVALEKY